MEDLVWGGDWHYAMGMGMGMGMVGGRGEGGRGGLALCDGNGLWDGKDMG